MIYIITLNICAPCEDFKNKYLENLKLKCKEKRFICHHIPLTASSWNPYELQRAVFTNKDIPTEVKLKINGFPFICSFDSIEVGGIFNCVKEGDKFVSSPIPKLFAIDFSRSLGL